MGWQREVVTTPAKAAETLEALEAPASVGEASQFQAAKKAVLAVLEDVSKQSSVLVSLSGHTDPNAEGFDPRNISIVVSRIEPERAKKRAAELEAEAKGAEEAEAAAEETAQRAREAADKAAEEAKAAEEGEPA